jgi:tol-pal system protein YbgF
MRLHPALAALAGAALALCAASQVPAQTSLDEPPLAQNAAARLDRMEKVVRELRAIVFQGRETGQPVVVQPAETQGQIASLSDHLADLDQTLARLNGQIEIIKHDLDQARQGDIDLRAQVAGLKEQVNTMDQKIAALAAPPPPPPAPVAQESAAPPPQDPAAAFAAAKGMLDAGDMASAEAGFRDYVDRFGDSPRGPEARYYLGRTLLAKGAFADAATADIGAIRGWPQTRWAPGAVLDLSRALVGMGKSVDACQTLDELAKRYPKAPPSIKGATGDLRTQAKCG